MSNRIRCAIYTRKSTEEGLEQDFNSLDAQREACEAYIQSQKGLGWSIIKKHYDDGGISGGTMDRPALQELLEDIEKGRVDLVVVYKVDRLTRSLMDFSKMIETFDSREVSFVSVTQQFSTADSMGRLTLNVLLSFAQFEREVTAERIRDKIAASKKKGMWMGGLAPLGYDNIDKKLVVNEQEAQTARSLFNLYLELGSIRDLKKEADRRGIRTKVRSTGEKTGGGKPFTRGHLQQLLRNPIYIGLIAHKGETFDGMHDAIINQETWDAVQEMLAGKAPARKSPTNQYSRSLLAGLLFDETGDRLTPSHARKGDRAYRYYISSRLTSEGNDDGVGWRLPQEGLDRVVITSLNSFLNDESDWTTAVNLADLSSIEIEMIKTRITELSEQLSGPAYTREDAIRTLVEKITIEPGTLSVSIKVEALNLNEKASNETRVHKIEIPFHTKRRGVENKIVIGGYANRTPHPDQQLIELVSNARVWFRKLANGEASEIRDIASEACIDAGDVSRFLPLAHLAPDIVEAILEGRQPVDLTAEKLKRIRSLPMDWEEQRAILGF
ncbi:MAG: recombinase family protein [Rhodospirillales bacterium]|jgi:site-specific DNA recombinase|nr:recombinase family protein [Rhodospirillales bacterium]MBT4626607.1 recombinase family protein [Rhodospirillales bacterium]MBT7146563.1 recombinase family protein [Rhodospirillales bacterium]